MPDEKTTSWGSWAEKDQQKLTMGLRATPAERLAWLEEMIAMAYRFAEQEYGTGRRITRERHRAVCIARASERKPWPIAIAERSPPALRGHLHAHCPAASRSPENTAPFQEEAEEEGPIRQEEEAGVMVRLLACQFVIASRTT